MTIVARLLTATILSALSCVPPATADELPSFKLGFWSFTSTVSMQGHNTPQVRTMTRCTDPGADIRSKWQVLAGRACRFSPVSHIGNRYAYSSTCDKDGTLLHMSSVITVDDATAYRVETNARTNQQVSKETIVARRVGECPK